MLISYDGTDMVDWRTACVQMCCTDMDVNASLHILTHVCRQPSQIAARCMIYCVGMVW